MLLNIPSTKYLPSFIATGVNSGDYSITSPIAYIEGIEVYHFSLTFIFPFLLVSIFTDFKFNLPVSGVLPVAIKTLSYS